MTIKKLTALLCGLSLCVLTSCIREEALNAEADIESVDSLWVHQLLEDGVLVGTPRIENSRVTFTVKKGTDVTAMAPRFHLTPGATIVPASGTPLDFTTPQIYTVTPENQGKSKKYVVSFELFNTPDPGPDPEQPLIIKYVFENAELEKDKYYRFFEIGEDGNPLNRWASGNSGFAMSGMAKNPNEYPTVWVEGGYEGKCLRLQTLSTGIFGQTFKMPIAAGNLFFGEFKTSIATTFPMKATRFGLPILQGKPEMLRGYYKYTAGPVYTDAKQKEHPELKDACDIYAVVYEIDPKKFEPLSGSDVKNSERIVLMAQIENPGEPQEWTSFELPFLEKNGKVFDRDKLANGAYAIALVFTSSLEGASFCGAVGSTLYVDEVELVYETPIQEEK